MVCLTLLRRRLRDPASGIVLEKLANALSENEGFQVADVHPAKGIDSGFNCQLTEQCELGVLLGVSARESGVISFDLITEWHSPRLRRLFGNRLEVEPICVQRWRDFLFAIDRQLTSVLGAQHRSVRVCRIRAGSS